MKPTPLRPLLAALLLSACARHSPDAGVSMRQARPPHGGTAVALGDDYNLEYVPDPSAGRIDAYVLDDDMEEFIRVPQASFQVVASVEGRSVPVLFRAVANPATGETVGDSSCFAARAPWLRPGGDFDAVLASLDVAGTVFSRIGVRVTVPSGGSAAPPRP